MKRILPLLVLLIFGLCTTLMAQNGAVTGRVIDAQTKEALPFTTVAAFDGDRLVTGTTTKDDGSFQLELPYGTYRLVIQFLSYAKKEIPALTVSADQPQQQLGNVAMAPAEETLQAVEVEAEAVEMQLSLDKKIFNVADNLAAKGGSATDILENIPSVSVDTEGNVSLRGSDNVRILIDGKPSGLTGADALRQLPADLIERVEVITNPSARYEAQGMAGILNIVLKKNRENGINGSIEATTGWPHNHGLSGNLNVRRKDANFFVNLSTRYRSFPGGGYSNYIFDDVVTETLENDYTYDYYYRYQDRDRDRSGWNNSVRVGADFYLTPTNTLTAAFLYNRGIDENESLLTNSFLIAPNEPTMYSERLELEDELDQNLEWSLDYRRTFDEKDKLLTGTLQYRLNSDDEDAVYTEEYRLPTGGVFTDVTDRQRSDNLEEEKTLLFQADFLDPLGELGQWEAGVRTSFREINNDYSVERFQGGVFEIDPEFTNDFKYLENIYAAYTQVGIEKEPFSYQLGLRAEYSTINTDLSALNQNEDDSRDYLSLFPSAFVTYQLSKLSSLQLSYSRRVRRPGFRELNPFFSLSDARSIRSGNPDLDPEFTSSVEAGYLRNWSKATLTSSLYYRHTTGVVQNISIFEVGENTGITRSFPVNLGVRQDIGFEFVLSADLAKWWTLNQSLNVFRSVTEPEDIALEGLNNDLEDLSAETFSWQTRLTSRMKLGSGINFQQTFFYMGPERRPQGRRLSMYMLNLGVSKEILDKKGTIALSVDDLLNTRKWRMETNTAAFIATSEFQWRRRSVSLTFNYRINQDRPRQDRNNRRQQGGGDNEDMDF